MITDESNRLKLQVEKVLQMAQFEKSEIDLNLTSCNVHELIHQASGSIQFMLDNRNGKLSVELNATDPILKVDELHFTNIIRNLLDNAIKYCTESPVITISTSDSKNGIQISVQDNGIGITPAQRKQVFEKFYRIPTGNVHNVKGFGLGLYYVKSLVEAHHGSVDVSSDSNGSTFIIFIPRLK